MLTKTDWKSIPPYGKQNRSPIRQFAYTTVMEFMEVAEQGDVFEVTGYPEMSGSDTARMTDRVIQAIRTELFHAKKQGTIKTFRRKGRVFMEYPDPIRPYDLRKPNPYPGDLPRVVKTAI